MRGQARRPIWMALAVTVAVLAAERAMNGTASTARIPVLTTALAPGARVGADAVRWVNPGKLRAATGGFAREPLLPGTVLDAAVVAPHAPSRPEAAVAVVPGLSQDAAAAAGASRVDVLVTTGTRVLWSSGPVAVDGSPAPGASGVGGGGTLVVWMRPRQAVQFELAERRGTVDVLGVSS